MSVTVNRVASSGVGSQLLVLDLRITSPLFIVIWLFIFVLPNAEE